MNKKFFIVSVFALLLGTTTVMADNHKFNDGPKKTQKEVADMLRNITIIYIS